MILIRGYFKIIEDPMSHVPTICGSFSAYEEEAREDQCGHLGSSCQQIINTESRQTAAPHHTALRSMGRWQGYWGMVDTPPEGWVRTKKLLQNFWQWFSELFTMGNMSWGSLKCRIRKCGWCLKIIECSTLNLIIITINAKMWPRVAVFLQHGMKCLTFQ